jgi:hypothetical protein
MRRSKRSGFRRRPLGKHRFEANASARQVNAEAAAALLGEAKDVEQKVC